MRELTGPLVAPGATMPGGARRDAEPDRAAAEVIGVLDAIDVPLIVVGRDCRLVRFNHAAQQTFRLTTSDVGRRVCELEALVEADRLETLCAQVMADAVPCRRELAHEDRRFLLRFAPYFAAGGEIEGAVLSFTNITAFRASIDQAIYEREYTKAILNTVIDPLVVLDSGLRIQTANRAFYSMFGVSRDETHGVSLRELGDDEWRTSTLWGLLEARLNDDREFQPLELEREFSRMGRRSVVIDARRLSREGEATMLLTFHDITARKEAEENVRRSQQALLEADRRKDEFLATLAHELRNPLAPIRNALHLLRLGDAPNVDVARVQDMMERQVAHMVRLVDDLLELSRISRGQIQLKKQRTELATVVAHAVEASRPIIDTRAHHLELSLPAEPLVVDGDPVRLSQIFANLLNNAAKYTEHGGAIVLSARREEETHIVSVRDTGIGIPDEMLTRIFEMFTQVDGVRGRSLEGLGIGLSLVRSLVTMHGGSVEARSAGLGRGSEFIVRLPAAEAGALPQASVCRVGCRASVSPALRILVVDDNEDSADTMAQLLSVLGAHVRVAYGGESALEVLRVHRPSVIVLDLGMPGIDGHEVARRVRLDPAFRDVTLVALTGWGQEENRRRTKEAGFDHHLVKPVEFETLEALLASLPIPEAAHVTGADDGEPRTERESLELLRRHA